MPVPAVATPSLGDAERALLLELLRVNGAGGGPLVADAVDWNALASRVPHLLAPLVLDRVHRRLPSSQLPVDALARLRNVAVRLTTQQLRQRAMFHTASEALRAVDIPVIVLKGMALAHLVYPDPTLRPMSDVDLWVPPDRLDQAAAVLMARGLEIPARVRLGVPAGKPFDRAHDRTLESPDGGVMVELHGLIPSLSGLSWANFGAAWQSALPVTLGRTPTHVLSPVHFLTHVALHAARRERFRTGLLPLLDLALLTERWKAGWDWDGLAATWNHERVGPWMLLCLSLARDALGALIPADLEARVGVPARWAEMRRLAVEQLWEAPHHRFLLGPFRVRARRGLVGWVRLRLLDYYWKSPEPRPLGESVADALRRLRFDVAVKLPRHFRAWRVGSLTGSTLRRGAELARRRHELERLVRAAGGVESPEGDL